MWHTKCDTDGKATQMTQIGRQPSFENIKGWKPKKIEGQRLKTYSGHHILSHHSTQNTPRAYVGKPTCFKTRLKVLFSAWPRCKVRTKHYTSLQSHKITEIHMIRCEIREFTKKYNIKDIEFNWRSKINFLECLDRM